MSFGFSVGDFITVGLLIKDIISHLRSSSSTTEYLELVQELQLVQQALDEIEHLRSPTPAGGHEEAVLNAIKFAAVMCQAPLEEFRAKLRKYEGFAQGQQQQRQQGQRKGKGRMDVVRGWGRKVQWGFEMREEVQKLQAYLAVHLASLNVRLAVLGM
jgi:hypothetical protein